MLLRRSQADFLGGPDGALGDRVEVTDGVNLVIEQLYAQRPFGPRRIDVDYPPSVAEATGRFDHGFVVIAQVQPLAEEGSDPDSVALLPDTQLSGRRKNTGHQLGRESIEQGRANRANDDWADFRRGADEITG